MVRFLDQAKICIRSGCGGNGCVAFRREKFIEFGGPDGGDGGDGGDILITAVSGLNTLVDFRYQQHFRAESGRGGMGASRTGRKGRNTIIQVPLGTQVLNSDRTKMLTDLTELGQEMLLARGGSGGFGNIHYKTSTNRTPYCATTGQPGEEKWVWLSLKLMADVGLIGLPNAGKSTFLATATRAHPRIADYPFTTLYPHLGTAYINSDSFIIAEIPGLIKDAHSGAGLGTHFLSHVERCSVLLHLVDGTAEDVTTAYNTVRGELNLYGHNLSEKIETIALSKIDLLSLGQVAKKRVALAEAARVTTSSIKLLSSVSGIGLNSILQKLGKVVISHTTEMRKDKCTWLP